jgi:hypothetical protein
MMQVVGMHPGLIEARFVVRDLLVGATNHVSHAGELQHAQLIDAGGLDRFGAHESPPLQPRARSSDGTGRVVETGLDTAAGASTG